MSATDAVDKIIKDLKDRRGFRQAWDQTDQGTRDEIRAMWIAILEAKLRKAASK